MDCYPRRARAGISYTAGLDLTIQVERPAGYETRFFPKNLVSHLPNPSLPKGYERLADSRGCYNGLEGEKTAMENPRTVIFLDIDGVLQPSGSNQRFERDLDELREELARKYNNDAYLEMDKYDLGAVYYDWDKKAVERLRKLCIETGAEIVITSDWRLYSPLSRLKDYFRLHDLDKYVTGEIPQISGTYRCDQVTAYLKERQDVGNFVILDDAYVRDFSENYPEQFIHCRYIFDDECYQRASNVLRGKSLLLRSEGDGLESGGANHDDSGEA